MDSVMINQLPELAIPKNRIFPAPNKMTVASNNAADKRNPYITKWYVLFDNRNDQWISFQPQVGFTVYPCYACRDMFGNRNSFLDHINRRGLVLKYLCSICKKTLTFYNTCSFLVHARDHFTEFGGSIDLDNVDISTIPMDIAGFMPIPNVPRLYDTNDESVNHDLKLSVKFFKPTDESIGKRIINFISIDLVFHCSNNNNGGQIMGLNQVNKNIPKCLFVSLEANKRNESSGSDPMRQRSDNSESDSSVISDDESDIICLDDDSHHTNDDLIPKSNSNAMPKIQVKNLNLLVNKKYSMNFGEDSGKFAKLIDVVHSLPKCPECEEYKEMSMKDHFQVADRPIDDNIKCKKCGLLSPSICSLRAHVRTHDKKGPFICPECGKGFDIWETLRVHMDDVCFHTAKTVRYKCPAKKCGKVFAQTLTFSTHFPIAHMKVKFSCVLCPEYFDSDGEYFLHSKSHMDKPPEPYQKIHECTVCSTPVSKLKQHVLMHVQDNDNRIYVYICKYCRSFYRSKQTYAAHLLRCSKLLLNSQVKKEVEQIESHNDMKCRVVKYCIPCSSKIKFHCTYKDIKNVSKCCPQCSTPFSSDVSLKNKSYHDWEYTDNDFIRKDVETDSFICVLCDKLLTQVTDKHSCKYSNPVVEIESSTELNNSYVDELDSPEQRRVSSSSDDSNKRKRKRLFNGSIKNKRQSTSVEKSPEDLLCANPNPDVFDGEYKCKLCHFKNESRKLFHDHIQEHRDVSTSYQCMECGECFVVKPSLLKHLQVFHLIEDVESYMKENECFDKEAVRMLKENMTMVPGEAKEPVAENQCRICRQHFPDSQELSKHFRVHGMAFLMRTIIK